MPEQHDLVLVKALAHPIDHLIEIAFGGPRACIIQCAAKSLERRRTRS